MRDIKFNKVIAVFIVCYFGFIRSAFASQQTLENPTIFDKFNHHKLIILSDSYDKNNKDPKIVKENLNFLENKKLNVVWVGDEYVNMIIGGESPRLSKTSDWAKIIAFQQNLPQCEYLIWFNNDKLLKHTATFMTAPKNEIENYNIILSGNNGKEHDFIIIKNSDWSSAFLELAFNSYDCQHYKSFTFSECLKKLYAENIFSANGNIFIYEKK